MKKILVTGAAGRIGFQIIKSLLTESKYEVTALDLKFKDSIKGFKKYGNRINFVFGDINDQNLIADIIKNTDVVIHLASVMPPLANMKPELAKLINYNGTKNIVEVIKQENPNCFLIYASTCCVYDYKKIRKFLKITDSLTKDNNNYYAKTKIDAEKIIKSELKNYTIFRLSPTFSSIKGDPIIFNLPLNSKLEMITIEDAAYAFTKAIENLDKLKGNIYNLSGGENCRTEYRDFLIKILKINGINYYYLKSLILDEKNYYSCYFKDSNSLEEILNFQTNSLNDYYYKRKKESGKFKRFIPRLLSVPFILFLKRKG